jgi:hypothetical protein
MLRQIVTPQEQSFTIRFPAHMVGKTVEIIAFELEEELSSSEMPLGTKDRLARIREITSNTLVDLSGFKFDRDNANDFSE